MNGGGSEDISGFIIIGTSLTGKWLCKKGIAKKFPQSCCPKCHYTHKPEIKGVHVTKYSLAKYKHSCNWSSANPLRGTNVEPDREQAKAWQVFWLWQEIVIFLEPDQKRRRLNAFSSKTKTTNRGGIKFALLLDFRIHSLHYNLYSKKYFYISLCNVLFNISCRMHFAAAITIRTLTFITLQVTL